MSPTPRIGGEESILYPKCDYNRLSPAHRQGQRHQGRNAELLETRKSKWVENLAGHTGLVAPSISFG